MRKSPDKSSNRKPSNRQSYVALSSVVFEFLQDRSLRFRRRLGYLVAHTDGSGAKRMDEPAGVH